ncbi:MAG: bifunctional 23S rRNA (guanine(2069)-N(7))-methyltransferase RlmK/23S rRNA (guanine(2445)-N(2))-methyltransferase RlmL [Atopobiaceae bacterium]|jgi:23S rRNA (guanine2445-N2)-methyltransferase / 23S rRNA (guanine2069-N7)-methyltransferase
MNFFATCPMGFEGLLAHELQTLNVPRVRQLKGQVSFEGELEDAYRVCLWSHVASRVIAVLARGSARDADALYKSVAAISWAEHIGAGATFTIDAHGTNRALRNTQFTAQRAKDAISDQLFSVRGARALQDHQHPDVTVAVRISREKLTVGIDLSGEPLFRRGWDSLRDKNLHFATLRPDYAAALLVEGGWDQLVQQSRKDHVRAELLALFSGTGTLLAEAALYALDRAPGLLRQRWGFSGWQQHDHAAWARLVQEAEARHESVSADTCKLLAYDPRKNAQQSARGLLRAAGIHEIEPTFVSQDELADTGAQLATTSLICVDLSWPSQTNPAEEAFALADVARAAEKSHAALTALAHTEALAQSVGAASPEQLDVMFGQTPGKLIRLDLSSGREALPHVTLRDGRAVPVLLASTQQFADRLWKVARERRKWAKREDVTCYRLYDADLPDYAVAIDLYQGKDGRGRWLSVSEYQAPKEIDALMSHERLMDVLTVAPAILEIEPHNVHIRIRQRAKGGSQYTDEGKFKAAKAGEAASPRAPKKRATLPPGAHLIEEGGLTFEVNFESRLDCGIFLDHRDTRSLVRELAKKTAGSKRFLNLFAYTGSATCYAADGGAKHTTTVDMSKPSLEWAKRNMAHNGFVGPEHEFVQADVLAWTHEQRHTPNRWDLIFCDVPTFSNSSRMRAAWDVQRDHVELLMDVVHMLTRNGVCVFSCNLRSFKMDKAALARYGVDVQDITASTIPHDFQRNPKIHHCYLVKRQAGEKNLSS